MLRKKKPTSSPSPTDRRRWKIGSAIIIGFFIAAIAFFGWLFYVGSPKEIVAVADQFKPDPSWTLENEHVVPPQTMCIDVECPSLSKTWATKHLLTREELQKRLDISGWEFQIDGDCLIKGNYYGTALPVCSARGIINNFEVVVSIRGSASEDSFEVNLSINEV